MPKEYPILQAIHVVPFLGERFLPGRWDNFVQDLRILLRASGIESPDSTPELLLFNYEQPGTAVTSFFEGMVQIKKDYEWDKTKGTLPLQIVFHLEKKGEVPPPFRMSSTPIWEGLLHEAIYLSRSLKVQWEQLAVKSLPPHRMEAEESGLFPLKFDDPSEIKKKKLFAHRRLMVKSGQSECFYCGMTTHRPNSCPSKFLTMESRAIKEVGYQSLEQINERFQAAMTRIKEMVDILTPGVGLAEIRQDPVLQAFIAYFDLFMIYQPRYLWHIAFSVHPVWDGIGHTERIKVDSRNLQTGLDCLRVGQYNQAHGLLMAENQLMGGKQFYAMVGLAFIALERDRIDDVAHHLQIAGGMAASEKEKIYISLLLSRFHDLAGHSWKAEHAIQSILNLYVDCHEVLYRKVQLLVRGGQGAQALKLISRLIDSERLYFMSALMDPVLLPIQGLVEDILAAHLQFVHSRASEAITTASADYEALKRWFDSENDQDLQMNLKALGHLEEQFARQSYYDCLDVAERARALSRAAPRLQEAKLDELNERVDNAVIRWNEYSHMWENYPYKPLFKGFQSLLRQSKRKMVEARSVAGESLARAIKRLESALQDVAELRPFAERMHKVRMALDTLRVFVSNLLLAEIVLCSLLFLLYPLLVVVLADQIGADFLQLLQNPGARKKIIFMATAIGAPMVAFAMTVRKIAD